MKRFLMIFLDGVGIGEKDKNKNPFFFREFKFLKNHFNDIPHLGNQILKNNDKYIFPCDACMGVPDLPLSGTGQTSIFCGINAQKKLGFHFGPFPHSELLPVIEEENIFTDLLKKGKKADFVNAYPKVFFDYIDSGKKRLSVTSLSCLYAGIRLKRTTDLRRGKALGADINNSRWINNLGYNIPLIKTSTAVNRLLNITNNNDFTLFEFFFTDHLGHGRINDLFDYYSGLLDDFLDILLTRLPDDVTLLICSDHGNYEDISIKSHTLHPAFCLSAGKHSEYLFKNIKSLDQIKPTVMDLMI